MQELSQDPFWSTVLPILAIAVLADGKVRDLELIEFTFEAQAIGAVKDPARILPRKHLKDWFHVMRPHIEAALNSDSRDAFIAQTLNAIDDEHTRQMLLTSVFGIAICDYELHMEETGFLRSAMQAWKVALVKEHDHIQY